MRVGASRFCYNACFIYSTPNDDTTEYNTVGKSNFSIGTTSAVFEHIAQCLTLFAGTIEYATMTEPLPSEQLAPESSSPSSIPSFHGANALNYRAPAVAAAASLGRKVKFEEIAVPPGGCVVHAQDCWHGSGPNLSTKRHRRALVVHFLRGDARFIDGHSLQVGL